MPYNADVIWTRWMRGTAEIYARYVNYCDDPTDNPFDYNEKASVSMLASGAVKADLLSLAEYAEVKAKGAATYGGLCDLWICDDEAGVEWSFEFKQVNSADPKKIDEAIDLAIYDANKLPSSGGLKSFGVIVLPKNLNSYGDTKYLEDFATDLQSRYFVHIFRASGALPVMFIGGEVASVY